MSAELGNFTETMCAHTHVQTYIHVHTSICSFTDDTGLDDERPYKVWFKYLKTFFQILPL